MCSQDSNISVNIDQTDSDLIYHDPNNDKSSEECWTCWTFPHVALRKDVIIENPKYCWMYPKQKRKELRKVVPNFEDHKTLYTKCDFKLEACAHEKILEMETLLKCYEKLFQSEIKLQSELIEKIWEYSFRYMLLKNSSCCVKVYPEIISAPTERRTLCEFFEFLSKLTLSNCRLSKFLRKIRRTFRELDERCAQLDKTVESPFIQGNGVFYLPLRQIYEMINDTFNYFYGTLCKLKCWAQLIDPSDTAAVDDYKYLLQSLDDFDGFLVFGEKECTCRRTKRKDCIKMRKPC